MYHRKQRFPWAALIVGLLLGAIGGLAYAWFLNPVRFVNIGPDRLSAEDQQTYVLLVSETYMQDRDLDRARARLSALGVRDMANLVAVQADAALLRGAASEEVRALSTLAEALGARPMAAEVFSGSAVPTSAPPVEATATPTFQGMPSPVPAPTLELPTVTPVPQRPTSTPDLLPEAGLSLLELTPICEDGYPSGRIEVYVFDEAGLGIPAVRVRVEWTGGQETFFTGLKPDVDLGYADFDMAPDTVYVVTLVGIGEPVVGIDSTACLTASGQTVLPTYRLVFGPPESGEGNP